MSTPENIFASEDINMAAYKAALESGMFKDLKPGTIVVFHEGKLITSGSDRTKLLKEIRQQGIYGALVQEIYPGKDIDMATPYIEE